MIAYTGQTRDPDYIRVFRAAGIGECTVRGELKSRKRDPWFYDNGAYRDWKARRPFNGLRFTRDMWRIRNARAARVPTSDATPNGVVLPDIVAGGLASLAFSSEWWTEVQDLPAYLAVQNGMESGHVERWLEEQAVLDLDGVRTNVRGIFVGGDLPWKLATGARWVEFAHARGLLCHVGRVGPPDRVRWAAAIGADSIDSCLPLMHHEHLGPWLAAVAEAA